VRGGDPLGSGEGEGRWTRVGCETHLVAKGEGKHGQGQRGQVSQPTPGGAVTAARPGQWTAINGPAAAPAVAAGAEPGPRRRRRAEKRQHWGCRGPVLWRATPGRRAHTRPSRPVSPGRGRPQQPTTTNSASGCGLARAFPSAWQGGGGTGGGRALSGSTAARDGVKGCRGGRGGRTVGRAPTASQRGLQTTTTPCTGTVMRVSLLPADTGLGLTAGPVLPPRRPLSQPQPSPPCGFNAQPHSCTSVFLPSDFPYPRARLACEILEFHPLTISLAH
jgi:hypothetical protein